MFGACVCVDPRERREENYALDDISDEDYNSMSKVKHLAIIPSRKIALDDDDDVLDVFSLDASVLGMKVQGAARLAVQPPGFSLAAWLDGYEIL
ncbi:hypothetical protein Tco_0933384 [Tanacetum coccineum]